MSSSPMMKLGCTVALGMTVAGPGCRIAETNTQHCNYNDGDAFCAQRFPDGSRPFCEQGLDPCVSANSVNGCVPDRPTDACYSPCGGESTLDENGDCIMTGESSGSTSGGEVTSSSGTTGDESTTTGPIPCEGNEDCTDAAAPFCEPATGECISCDLFDDPDAACAGLDPMTSICAEGMCVECTPERADACEMEALVCDEATNTCVPCTEHAQCGEAACNLFTGACLPADAVVHVGGPKPDFATILQAVESFDARAEGTIIVHGGNYNELITVDSGRVLAFLASPGDLPEWTRTAGDDAPTLVVSNGTLLMDGLQLSGNDSSADPGVLVDGGRAWLDRSRVVDNNGGGIVAQNNAELVARNCFIGGGNANNVAALRVDNSSAEVLYASLAGGFAAATALSCSSPTNLLVRNSILLLGADTDAVDCSEANIVDSATEGLVGMFNGSPDWFSDFFTGDFHLTTEGKEAGEPVFRDIAQWQAGDPTTDIDGDPRPNTDGAPDYAGADVPQ